MVDRIIDILKQGEGIKIEFKESKNKINKDLYESICAFLNRNGGEILLGVKDNGEVVGVDVEDIGKIKKDFTTSMNNINKISPTYYLSIEEITIEGKKVLYIFIPESSLVHRCNGKIFDRSHEGDINITDHTSQVAAMYQRKETTYFETTVYPNISINDLREDLIARARKTASLRVSNHPWSTMDDLELLKSAGLYAYDYKNKIEGFNLASVLLLGKDQVILSILPYHKTDAILRRINLDRYDDRDDIRTNLIESYSRLLAFINKHLSDTFYLEGDIRISIRDKIFREVVSNILIHRNYANAYPAKLIIGKDAIYTENANKPHGYGIIDPKNFSPFPKNPTIAKFFKEIGLVDELGSGVRNIHKYGKTYFGYEPQIIEDEIFKIIFKTSDNDITHQATHQVTPQATHHDEKVKALIEFCKVPKTRSEIQEFMNIKDRTHFRIKILKPLIESGTLKLTVPDKPRSPNQKYYSAKVYNTIIVE